MRNVIILACMVTALAYGSVDQEPAAGVQVAPPWLVANSGGIATVAIANENAYARAIPGMQPEQLRTFTFGNRLFNTNWIAAPASVEAFDGLGPLFNRVSCSGCHTRDGRGRPPELVGESLESMLIRISVPGRGLHGGVKPVPRYGDQLNEKSLPGVSAEGRTVVRWRERSDAYPDGERFSLAVPDYQIINAAYGPLPSNVMLSARVAPPVFGLGLLEALPESQILANADPYDADHDGISGRTNRVWDVRSKRMVLGRFGWKASQPSLRQQIAAAAIGDIGLTTSMFPLEAIAAQPATASTVAYVENAGPDLKDDFLEKLAFYVQTLAVPAARNTLDARVRLGASLFARSGCAACHAPTLTTGEFRDIPDLSYQTIHPFTDLLLHDMGEELADHRPDFAASGREWRTPPLWGIGLTNVVSRHTRFLHDGRARSVEEAILWHGGEARAARDRFMQLPREERSAILSFLQNL